VTLLFSIRGCISNPWFRLVARWIREVYRYACYAYTVWEICKRKRKLRKEELSSYFSLEFSWRKKHCVYIWEIIEYTCEHVCAFIAWARL